MMRGGWEDVDDNENNILEIPVNSSNNANKMIIINE